MQTEINHILQHTPSITLEDMRDIHLMDRIDTKFVAPASVLPRLLEDMADSFRVQENNQTRLASYATQYLDTDDLKMFVMHQNGKLSRQKIRIRTYMDSHISFLEIKNKNNKGRTKKTRVPINCSHIEHIDDLQENRLFLDEKALFGSDYLRPSLGNNFHRITYVNNRLTERITIDLHLKFYNYHTGKERMLNDVVILELKQDGCQHSDFRDILMRLRIKQRPFSKYCMGTVMTNSEVKHNRFKERINLLQKYSQL